MSQTLEPTMLVDPTGPAELDASLARVVGKQVPGVSLAVASRDRAQWSTGGLADVATRATASPETVYPWFSMTKIVTATAIMQLHERAIVDLDAPASEWVPALRRNMWHGNTLPITVRQLLSHTSGLSNPMPAGWVHPACERWHDSAAFTDRLLQKHSRLKFEPGARTAYSNLGYLALGLVIAAASKQTYEDYVREHILHPLGMTATDFEPIPCRLREATFVLDGLMEHETELDPRTVFTDTHGYTEVVMATAALLGKALAPRIARMHELTLYKVDRSRHYPNLDSILDGTVKPHLVRRAWDETVRVIASIYARTASPLLILHRPGSYARQHSVHQALNEIVRVERTLHVLRTIDDEEFRRQQSRELNKGEAAHDLSRFLFFGKEGTLRSRSFDDQFRSFSCLGVLHNAVVAWNTIHIGTGRAVAREGHAIDDTMLAQTTPLMRKHLNPFGRYHFDLDRMRQTGSR